MKTTHRKNFYKNGAGAYVIKIPCNCGRYLFLQDSEVNGQKAFSFDGNYENPTFSPSIKPWNSHCNSHLTDKEKGEDVIGYPRCHFHVRTGIVEHCSDSKYPNQKMKLVDISEDFKKENELYNSNKR